MIVLAGLALGAFLMFRGVPETDTNGEATIGAAKRHRAPQISEKYWCRDDAEMQEWMQGETFDLLLRDQKLRKVLTDGAIAQALQDPAVASALSNPALVSALSSPGFDRARSSMPTYAASSGILAAG